MRRWAPPVARRGQGTIWLRGWGAGPCLGELISGVYDPMTMRRRLGKARGQGSGPPAGPAEGTGADERFDWSPYDAPARALESHLSWDYAVQERLDLYFADWWRPARAHREWLRIPSFESPDDSFIWWDLGGEPGQEPRSPRLEVAGEPPPEAVAGGLPEAASWAVRQAGWWVVAGISFEEAKRWETVGITNGVAPYRWAKALGEDVQVAFPGTDLATQRSGGRWSPTEAGLQAHQRFHALGVRVDHLRGRWLRLQDLAAASEGSLERAYELVEQWTEVARLLPCGPPTPLICEALDWVGFGLDIEEAKEWAQVARVPMTKVCAWREQGFTPFGASLWYQSDLEEEEQHRCFGPVHQAGRGPGTAPGALRRGQRARAEEEGQGGLSLAPAAHTRTATGTPPSPVAAVVGRAVLGAEGPAGLLPHAVLGLRAEGAAQKCTAKELTSTAQTSRPSLSPAAGGLALVNASKSLGPVPTQWRQLQKQLLQPDGPSRRRYLTSSHAGELAVLASPNFPVSSWRLATQRVPVSNGPSERRWEA